MSPVFELNFASEQPMVGDHRLLGKCILPAAAYLEMALANVDELEPLAPIQLSQIKILAPLLIADNATQAVHIEIQEQNLSRTFAIKSRLPDRWQEHGRGQIETGTASAAPDLDLAAISARCGRRVGRDEYYCGYRQAGVEYGPYYRSISSIQANASEVMAELRLSEIAAADQDFVLHPALLDGAFQSLGIFSLGAGGNALYLPFFIEAVVVYRPLPSPCFCYGKRRDSTSSATQKYDLTLCNDHGQIVTLIRGFTVKVAATRTPAAPERQHPATGVAIIGMAGRFPGAANVEQFWHNIVAATPAITEIPDERWQLDEYYHPHPATPGKTHCRWGSFLADADKFDPMFFGISVNKAALLDPQQRLMLQTAWHAIEDAGYAGRLSASNTGVYIGICNNEYIHASGRKVGSGGSHVAAGNTLSAVANRISYCFDLHGPSMAIDTACSSSLFAIYHAYYSLLHGKCDYALVGGVNLTLSPGTHIVFSKAGVLSADGHCRPFDDNANGYLRGEGVAAVLLKRLDKAIADHDNIHAVIRGVAVNHSGKTNGFNTPSAIGQKEVILQAYRDSGIELSTVSYIEAHGTGTPLGDSIEFRALVNAFREQTSSKGWCALGSIKGNLGHQEAAAGISAIIKVVLALKHRQIPPHANFHKPSRKIDLVQSPFFISTRPGYWPDGPTPRRAGVNSFGFGGANAHVILEQAPQLAATTLPPKQPPLLVISARYKQGLLSLLQALQISLENRPDLALDDICATLAQGRDHYHYRAAIGGRDRQEVQAKLRLAGQDLSPGPGIFIGLNVRRSLRLALLFSGAYLENQAEAIAASEFYRQEPCFVQAVAQCQKIIDANSMPELASIHLLTGKQKRYLALINLVRDYATAQMLVAYGIVPQAVAGSGWGKYSAAVLAGAISLDQALNAVLANHQEIVTTAAAIPWLKHDQGGFRLNKDSSTLLSCADDFNQEAAGEWLRHNGYEVVLTPWPCLQELSMLMGRLYASGVAIDWQQYYHGQVYHKCSLPTYPFKPTRYWL